MKSTRAIILLLAAFALLVIVCMSFASSPEPEKQPVKKKKYDPDKLMMFTIDADMEQTKANALKQYKTFPPLRPERFRRRIKMIIGIDIRDYPENALIWFGGSGYDDSTSDIKKT